MIFDYDLYDPKIGWFMIEIHARQSTRQFSVMWGRKITGPVEPYVDKQLTDTLNKTRTMQRDNLNDYITLHEKETAKP